MLLALLSPFAVSFFLVVYWIGDRIERLLPHGTPRVGPELPRWSRYAAPVVILAAVMTSGIARLGIELVRQARIPVVKQAAQELRSPKATERLAALQIIAAQGEVALEVLDPVVAALGDSDQRVVNVALGVLYSIGEPAYPRLIEALGDEDYLVRGSAAWALGCGKQEAKLALPALRRTLADEQQHVRWCAAIAMVWIDPRGSKDARAVLEEALANSPDPTMLKEAKAALDTLHAIHGD